MSRVVLVVAVVLLGAGRVMTRLGRRCLRRSLRLVRGLFSTCHPGCMHALHPFNDYKFARVLYNNADQVCILLIQVHHRYMHTVAPRRRGNRGRLWVGRFR